MKSFWSFSKKSQTKIFNTFSEQFAISLSNNSKPFNRIRKNFSSPSENIWTTTCEQFRDLSPKIADNAPNHSAFFNRHLNSSDSKWLLANETNVCGNYTKSFAQLKCFSASEQANSSVNCFNGEKSHNNDGSHYNIWELLALTRELSWENVDNKWHSPLFLFFF